MNRPSMISALSGRLVAPVVVVGGLVVGGLVVVGTGHVAVAAAPPSRSDSVVLRLAGGASQACTLAKVSARHHLKLEETVHADGAIHLAHGTDPSLPNGHRGARAVVKKLAKDRCVALAEIETIVTLASDRFHSWSDSPPTPAAAAEWQSQEAVTRLGLSRAHRTSRGAGTVVAVLDTGVDAAHPALAGRLASGWDYVDDDSSPVDGPCGCDTNGDGVADGAVGHGTYVAGTVSLVAPSARILPMRVLDSDGQGSALAVTDAIQDAVNADVDVISLSFGTDDQDRSQILEDAISNAENAGVLVVAAAGNSGTATEHYPANLPTVLGVGAMDSGNSKLATFSNYGRWVSVAAVGTSIVGPAPGNGYVRWSGTSVSTPVVAGQAALLRGAARRASVAQLRDAMVGSTTSMSERKIRYGRINLSSSLSRIMRDDDDEDDDDD